MTETENAPPPRQYGSLNSRTLAATIDLGLVMLLAVPVSSWVSEHMFEPLDMQQTLLDLSHLRTAEKLQYLYDRHVFAKWFVRDWIQLCFIALYTLPFWFRYSTTPGKMLFRMIIADEVTGARMTRSQACLRFFGYMLSMLAFGTGFICIGFNRKRLGYHDMLARTVVLKRKKHPQ